VQQANAYLASLEAEGDTNYLAAALKVQSVYDVNTPPADQSFVYFLSDGKPTAGDALSPASVTQWDNFLTSHNIKAAIAVGVGGGVDDAAGQAALQTIAFHEGPIIITAGHEDEIFQDLVQTVNKVVTGNIFTDSLPGTTPDQFGADGPGSPKIASITLSGVTYTFDGTNITNEATHAVIAGSTLIVNTGLGGVLEFHFADQGAFTAGDYIYGVPTVSGTQHDNITYTIQDHDGDTSSATLSFTVADTAGTTPHLVEGTAGNDAAVNGSPNSINIIGGGDGDDHITGGNLGDHVSGGAGADTIDGGAGNDILIGGTTGEVTNSDNIRAADLGDLIKGGDGNDFLYGGDGNDTLIGGHGADTINVQDGPHSSNANPDHDTIVYQDILDAGDTILHFRATDTNGATVTRHDTIDLTQLFDNLLGANSTTAERAAAVHIAQSAPGADIQIQIDTDHNPANGFEVTLATIHAPNFTAGTLQVGNDPAVDQIVVGGT